MCAIMRSNSVESILSEYPLAVSSYCILSLPPSLSVTSEKVDHNDYKGDKDEENHCDSRSYNGFTDEYPKSESNKRAYARRYQN